MSQIFNCQVVQEINAPKRNANGAMTYKMFRIGQKVDTKPLSRTMSNVQMMVTQDGFVIPSSHLRILNRATQNNSRSNFDASAQNKSENEVEYATVVEDKPKVYSLPMNNVVNSDFVSKLKTKSKASVNGAVIGLVAGFVYAVAKGKNKLIFTAIGSVGGFFLGSAYSNFMNIDENSKKDDNQNAN